jgi:hypothetical protein
MTVHIKGLRVIFERGDRAIESSFAVDGADARDIALMFIGRFDELADGDKLTVRKE